MSMVKITNDSIVKLSPATYLVEDVTTKIGDQIFLICRDNRKSVAKDYGWKVFEGAALETANPTSAPHDRRVKAVELVQSRLRKGEYLLAGELASIKTVRHMAPIDFGIEKTEAAVNKIIDSAMDASVKAIHEVTIEDKLIIGDLDLAA
jgi:hypothetical protein